MKRSSLVYLSQLGSVLVTLMALAPAARAEGAVGAVSAGGGGAGAGIGVGASQFVSGFTGAQVVFDTPRWHVEAQTAFDTRNIGGPGNPRVTLFDFGVSGWYHLSLGASSDFSLGGGFQIITRSGAGSANAEVLEPGAQVRVFVTPNVAVHALIAFPLVFGDTLNTASNNGVASSFGFNGQLTGAFGFTYFFR
jgi:hypothetical protein